MRAWIILKDMKQYMIDLGRNHEILPRWAELDLTEILHRWAELDLTEILHRWAELDLTESARAIWQGCIRGRWPIYWAFGFGGFMGLEAYKRQTATNMR